MADVLGKSRVNCRGGSAIGCDLFASDLLPGGPAGYRFFRLTGFGGLMR